MKKGYQLEFFMEQNARHDKQQLHEWLIEQAREQGITGATVFMGAIGFGQQRRLHSAHFFELLDQPVEITMIVTEEEAKRLLAFLANQKLELFYVKIPVEFGRLDEGIST